MNKVKKPLQVYYLNLIAVSFSLQMAATIFTDENIREPIVCILEGQQYKKYIFFCKRVLNLVFNFLKT
jgi:hypothetical protein